MQDVYENLNSEDILLIIFQQNLNYKDLINLTQTSKKFKKIAQNNILWQEQTRIHFPNDYDIAEYEASTGTEINWFKVFINAYKRDYQTYNSQTSQFEKLDQRQIQLRSLIKANDLAGIQLAKPTFDELTKVTDHHNLTALDYVAKLHREEIAKYLFKEVFSTLPTNTSKSINWVHTAAYLGFDQKMMKTLLNRALLEFPSNYLDLIKGMNPIDKAITTDNDALLKDIFPNPCTPHHISIYLATAARSGAIKAINQLLPIYKSKSTQAEYDTVLKEILLKLIDYRHFAIAKNFVKNNKNLINFSLAFVSGRRLQVVSPLHLATKLKFTTMIKFLLAQGADTEFEDDQERTAVFYAIQSGHIATIQSLINTPGSIKELCNLAAHINESTETTQTIKDFIAAGVSLTQTYQNKTPLQHAVTNGTKKGKEITELFLQNLEDVRVLDIEQNTLLHFCSNNEILNFLLEKDKNFLAKSPSNTPLPQMVNIQGNTPLHAMTLSRKIDPPILSSNGLLYYPSGKHARQLQPINLTIIPTLLEAGIQIDAKNKLGETALMLAAKSGDIDLFKFLVKQGACIDATNNDGQNILNYALLAEIDDILKYVIKKQLNLIAKINPVTGDTIVHTLAKLSSKQWRKFSAIYHELPVILSNSSGISPLHIACSVKYSEILGSLLTLGADLESTDNKGETPLHVAARNLKPKTFDYLVKRSADVTKITLSGDSVLHIAVSYGNTTIVTYILDKKLLDVNIANIKTGHTPLHITVIRGNTELLPDLIKAGANIDAINFDRQSSLHLAIEYGRKDIFTLLLKEKADVMLKDAQGNNLLHLLIQYNHLDWAQQYREEINFSILAKVPNHEGKFPIDLIKANRVFNDETQRVTIWNDNQSNDNNVEPQNGFVPQ